MIGSSPGMVFGNALIGGCGPFVSTVAATIAAGAAWTPSSLGAALKAWYKADAGVLARTAAQFTIANSESLSVASNSGLQAGDVNFWWAGWILQDATASNQGVVTKGLYASSNVEWSLQYEGGVPTIRVSADGTTSSWLTNAKAWSSAMTAGTWHFVMIYHDPTNNLIGISVDGAAFLTASFSGGTYTGTGSYFIGKAGDTAFFGGRVGNAVWGKSNTETFANIRDHLYNSGNGRRYADATLTNFGAVSWWELDENSGTRADKIGGNTLTDNNTVTANDGKVSYAAADGDAAWSMDDADDDFGDFLQTTFAARLIYRTDLGRGRLRSTGSPQFMSIASVTLAQPLTLAVVYKSASAGAVYEMAVSGTPGSVPAIFKRDDDKFVIGAPTEAVAANSDTALHSHIACFNGASSTYHLDGVAQSLSANPGTDDWSAEALSIMGKSDGGNPMDGDFCELVAISGVLSDADRANLQTYLKNRWGTP